IDLSLSDGFQMVLQGNNCRYDIERQHPCLKALYFDIDDNFRTLRFFPPVGDVRRNRLLQIVDVINENTVQLIHFWIDVAWHRDIDEEHWAVLAPAQKQFSMLAPEDGVRRAGGCDNNVGAIAGVVELFKTDSFTAEPGSQLPCALVRAIGYKNRSRAVRQKVTCSQVAHLAGS